MTIHDAASQNDQGAIREFIKQAADLNATDDDGMTPLILAAENGYVDVIHMLVNAGAQVDAAYINGSTALMFAAMSGKSEALHALLELGADINRKNHNLSTAIHFAAREGELSAIELLISRGASINVADINGFTTLMKASMSGHDDAVRILLEGGAQVGAVNAQGDNAFRLALLSNHIPVLDVLGKYSDGLDATLASVESAISKQDSQRLLELLSSPEIKQTPDGMENEKDIRIVIPTREALRLYSITQGCIVIGYNSVYRGLKEYENLSLISSYHSNLIRSSYPELFEDKRPTKESLQQNFDEIYKIVKSGLEDARKYDRKLLILFGETHDNIKSLLNQIMLFHAAKQSGVNTIYCEMSKCQFLDSIAGNQPLWLTKTLRNTTLRKSAVSLDNQILSMPYAFFSMGMKVIPMNLETSLDPHAQVIRREHMEKTIFNSENDAIIVCGRAHLKHLYDKTQGKYHTILIDGIGDDQRKLYAIRNMGFAIQLGYHEISSYSSIKTNEVYINENIELMSLEEVVFWKEFHEIKNEKEFEISGSLQSILSEKFFQFLTNLISIRKLFVERGGKCIHHNSEAMINISVEGNQEKISIEEIIDWKELYVERKDDKTAHTYTPMHSQPITEEPNSKESITCVSGLSLKRKRHK